MRRKKRGLETGHANHVNSMRRTVANVRVGVVQYQMRAIKRFEEFAQQCEFFVDTAADYKSDFIVFPELFTVQLLSVFPDLPAKKAARTLAALTPRYIRTFKEMASRFKVNIVAGSQFTVENGRLYNIAYFFHRNGNVEKQYKIHITPSERAFWGVEPGNEVNVIDSDRGKIAVQICYDIEFPELSRVAVAKGAQMIFVPFNTDLRHGYLRVRHCAQARCVENHVFVAVAGCVGNLPFVHNADIHYAQSGIFTPADIAFARDAVAAECMPNIETVIFQDLDLETLKRHRKEGSVQNWNDRRTDLYRVVYREKNTQREI